MFNQHLETTFRLYQSENSKYKSSFFDLIDGDRETKQTKGLAYLLNMSPELLDEFLTIDKIHSKITKVLTGSQYKLFKESDFVKIDAEMISDGIEKIRRDITLTFYYKSLKVFILIIEAKNIKFINESNIEEQLQKYVDPKFFPNDKNVPKIAITLTRYKQSFLTNKFLSITWTDIIQALYNILRLKLESTKSLLLKDYYNFITGVDKRMNYYEKEILSVPAGKTFEEINKHHIHACPNTPPYNYRDPLFIAFRQKGGGVMDKLYKIDDIFVLSPENTSVLKVIEETDLSYKERLLAYIADRKIGHGFKKNDMYRFYVLSEAEHISLHHHPHPQVNNSGGWYYTLTEMLSGRQTVYTDSK